MPRAQRRASANTTTPSNAAGGPRRMQAASIPIARCWPSSSAAVRDAPCRRGDGLVIDAILPKHAAAELDIGGRNKPVDDGSLTWRCTHQNQPAFADGHRVNQRFLGKEIVRGGMLRHGCDLGRDTMQTLCVGRDDQDREGADAIPIAEGSAAAIVI